MKSEANTTTDRKLRAVVYMRVARDDGPRTARATTAQREACERIAAKHGLTLVREYVDLGRAARFEEQLELQRLLADLEQKRDAAFVVTWNYGRLAHSTTQTAYLNYRLQSCAANILTTDDPTQPDEPNPAEQLVDDIRTAVIRFLSDIAKFESAERSASIKAGIARKRAAAESEPKR